MTNIKTLAGSVTNLSVKTKTTGTINSYNGQVSGTITTTRNITFRINNTPIFYEGDPEISNGDYVSVAGEGSGTFTAYALRNHTTNLVYWTSGKLGIALAAAFFLGLFGLPFCILGNPWPSSYNSIGFVIEILCLGLVSHYYTDSKKRDEAKKMMMGESYQQQNPFSNKANIKILAIILLALGGIVVFLVSLPSIMPIAISILSHGTIPSQKVTDDPTTHFRFKITRVDPTTIKIVYLGSDYPNTVKAISWGVSGQKGENQIMGDDKSNTPLPIGSVLIIHDTNLKSDAYPKVFGTAFFLDGSWNYAYSDTVFYE
jgi:hypothetical protein